MKREYKFSLIMLLIALLGLTISVSAAEVSLKPVADTYIRDGDQVDTNFGDIDVLELKWEADRGGMTRIAYLTFNIADLASVESATLRLYAEWVDQLEVRELAVRDISGVEWSENELTWENAPQDEGALIGHLFVVSLDGIWYELDVTKEVQQLVREGASSFSVRIENLDDHWGGLVRFSSKEGGNSPQLVVVN